MSTLSRDGNVILADCESVMEQCLAYNKKHITAAGYFRKPKIKPPAATKKRSRKQVEEDNDDDDNDDDNEDLKRICRKQRDDDQFGDE